MRTLSLTGPFLVALSAMACSPALEAPAKGSAHYSIDVSSDNDCGVPSTAGIGDGVGNVPDLPSGSSPPVYFGEAVTDGQAIEGVNGTYVVQCRVSGDSSFDLSVTMKGPNYSPQAGEATGGTTIEVSGTIGADGEGSGSVAYVTTFSGGGTNAESTPCTLSAIPADGGGFQISEGSARFTFYCAETTPALAELTTCEIKGTIDVSDCIEK